MGVFKLDLMTILVLFVILSVIFTMTSGAKETKSVAPATTVQKPVVQGFSNVNASEFSTTSIRGMSPKVTGAKFGSKTWN
ncbi:hypothetical protein [Kaarinaea lacus]